MFSTNSYFEAQIPRVAAFGNSTFKEVKLTEIVKLGNFKVVGILVRRGRDTRGSHVTKEIHVETVRRWASIR